MGRINGSSLAFRLRLEEQGDSVDKLGQTLRLGIYIRLLADFEELVQACLEILQGLPHLLIPHQPRLCLFLYLFYLTYKTVNLVLHYPSSYFFLCKHE